MKDTKTNDIPKPTASTLVARERATELIGRVISDRYRILEVIAMGGMGAVYRGEHVLMKKRVAIKILHPMVENQPEIRARFEREAIAGAHIQHPGVAVATDFGELKDGSYFLVLEHVRGRTLHEIIRQGPMDPERAARIAKQIAVALHAVHRKGIVHRDLKPRNIMLSEGDEEVAKIIDFGLAKVQLGRLSTGDEPRSSVEEKRLTGVGVIFGTIAYLAPEAAIGMDVVDARSDLYALGVILYEMLAGKHPFEARDSAELFRKQRFETPPPIAARSPGVKVSRAIEAVVMRLLEKDPDARFQSGLDLSETLDAALAEPDVIPELCVRKEKTPPAPPESEGPALSISPLSSEEAARTCESTEPSTAEAADDEPAPRALTTKELIVRRRRRTATLVFALALLAGVGVAIVSIAPFGKARSLATGAASSASVSALSSAPSASASPPMASAPIAATTSAVPQRTQIDGIDASGYRALLVRAAHAREWPNGETALLSLASLDRTSFARADVLRAARDVAVALENAAAGDKVFDTLAHGLGSEGLDVLYEIVQGRGGSRAAVRAALLLRDEGVMAHATPALEIAFALREAPCAQKLTLLDRASREGDERALIVLETLGVACFKKNKELERTIREMRIRLTKP